MRESFQCREFQSIGDINNANFVRRNWSFYPETLQNIGPLSCGILARVPSARRSRLAAVIRTLSFSSDGAFLQTDRGRLRIVSYSDSSAVSRPNLPGSIFVNEQWVSWGMKNILWLPSEYWPNDVAVYGSIVGLGCLSGRVVFMEFAF
jgi:hypothetical protein